MFEIVPGILEKDWETIKKKIEIVLPFAKTIHIDVLDGKFTDNITFLDPAPFAKYMDKINFEVHLMVEDPIKYLKPWADAGFKRFIAQIERMPDQAEFVAQAQLLGEVVLALDKPTPVGDIKVPYEDLDGIFIMTVKAGFSGQVFIEDLLEKVVKVREKTNMPIEVDGGINNETILKAFESGVNRLVATSILFNSENPAKKYEELKKLLENR